MPDSEGEEALLNQPAITVPIAVLSFMAAAVKTFTLIITAKSLYAFVQLSV